MAETPFAASDDVAARWRTLSTDEAAVANVLAGDASEMIRERWTDTDARIASGDLLIESVTRVVAGMVKRAMINADAEGLESRSVTAGPFAQSDKFANPLSSLFFTASDILVFEPEDTRRTVYQAWLA